MIRSSSPHHSGLTRAGFTLIELLVVITIMVLLLSMTVLAVNFSRDSERVVGAALQVQSFLSGARDRAIHAKEPRGVRFFLDTNNHRAITAMAYIDPAEYWSGASGTNPTIQLQRPDLNNDGNPDSSAVTIVAGNSQNQWWQLKRRGLLFDGLRIRIPKGSKGTWYTVSTELIDITSAPPATQYLRLATPYADPGDNSGVDAFGGLGPKDYELELPPRILPMDPVKLPDNTIIDLDGSRVPLAWRPISAGSMGTGNLDYSHYMDIVFSPRGTVVGGAAAGGVIQLYICDQEDSNTLKEQFIQNDSSIIGGTIAIPALPTGAPATTKLTANGVDLQTVRVLAFNQAVSQFRFVPTSEIRTSSAPWLPNHPIDDPYLPRDRRIVSIFTQTGAVSSHPVYVTDGEDDGIESDPMYFAETGRTGQ
jgi:prepilin-type N-terminal cleavage/methylation domain-containing protein